MNNVFEDHKKSKEDAKWSGEMTFDEVYKLALTVFPYSQVETDNDGQWIIYTDIKEKE